MRVGEHIRVDCMCLYFCMPASGVALALSWLVIDPLVIWSRTAVFNAKLRKLWRYQVHVFAAYRTHHNSEVLT